MSLDALVSLQCTVRLRGSHPVLWSGLLFLVFRSHIVADWTCFFPSSLQGREDVFNEPVSFPLGLLF